MKSSIALLCASMFLAAPAFAETSNVETVTAELYYDHTVLNTPEGATATYASLVKQAKEVCRVDLYGFNHYDRRCVATMAANAVEKINAPMLTAVYEGSKLPITLASN
ncbi:MAG: UrcA family protein [Henriciella sp.]|nr:UrcA family protein [Henriciella sp.]